MKSTWFGCPRRHEFGKLLRDAGPNQDFWRTYSDWLTCAHLSLSQGVHCLIHGSKDPGREEEYLRAIKPYNAKLFADGMGVMAEALEEKRYDFLGSFAGEMNLLDGEWRGQFFTPPELCRMMASMTLQDAKPEPGHRFTVCEPACGGGAMIIAVCNELMDRGFYPWNYWVDCTDVDYRMFQACYIQLTLCGVPGVVRCGNSLTLEVRKADATLVGALHPLRPSQRGNRQTEPVPEPEPAPTLTIPRQQTLFDLESA